MTTARNGILPLALSVAVLLTGACGNQSSKSPDKAVVVLFDLSESTNRPRVREAYCQNFGEILSSVDHGDALAAGWILESSVTQPTLPVDTVFPEFTPGTTNPLMKEAKRAKADSMLAVARDSLRARVCRALRSSGRKVTQTDIMTSLDLAARIFEARGKEEQTLVIMSDMIEDSERYQFDETALATSRRKEILQVEQEAGRLPRLSATEVCIVGASAAETDKYYHIEQFWRAYFDSADAEILSYGGPYVGC